MTAGSCYHPQTPRGRGSDGAAWLTPGAEARGIRQKPWARKGETIARTVESRAGSGISPLTFLSDHPLIACQCLLWLNQPDGRTPKGKEAAERWSPRRSAPHSRARGRWRTEREWRAVHRVGNIRERNEDRITVSRF